MNKHEFQAYFESLESSPQELLHEYAAKGDWPICEFLLQNGYSWNFLLNNQSIGDVALQNGHLKLYEQLKLYGIRVEYILKAAGQRVVEDGDLVSDPTSAPNSQYLKRRLYYSKDGTMLLDQDKNAVMMGWETPIMEKSVEILELKGKRVLNVGFGLGIIDKLIQTRNPLKHTIIEAHPDVYQYMLDNNWDKIENVKILFGRWQDQLDSLELYDAIYFDTFGEYYDDLNEFHNHLPNILDQDGIYSFFNGLGGTNQFFHDVYCDICVLDLQEMGLRVEFKELKVEELGDEVWKETKRPYWSLATYRLPIVKFES